MSSKPKTSVKEKPKITVKHSAEETSCFGLPQYKYYMEVEGHHNYTQKKTAFRSLPIESDRFINYALVFLILCVLDFFLKGYGLKYSLSMSNPYSIKNLQDSTSDWRKEILMLQSPLGGGAELNIAALAALIFLPRSRFFYYLTVAGIEQALTLQLRLFWADPRPFHIDQDITPWMCYSTYGNPGDHSLAGVTAAIVIFLDVFHGTPVSYSYDNSIFHGWLAYVFSILFGLYWAMMMPYTRYLGGLQSMDQLIFGAFLGLQLGIFCHFVMRDHLIGYFERLMNWQNETKGLLNFIKERSDDDDKDSTNQELKVREKGYDRGVFKFTLEGQEQEEGENEFHPFRFILYSALIWICVMGLGTIAFLIDNWRYPEKSETITTWLNNLDFHGCGKFTYDTTFHNAMFLDVGRITLVLASMVIFIQRRWIGIQLVYNYKIQDGSNISQDRKIAFFQIMNRLVVLALILSIYVLAEKSGQLIKGEPDTSIGNRFFTMFETRIIPLLMISYLLNSGVYDLGSSMVQKYLVDKLVDKYVIKKDEENKKSKSKSDKKDVKKSDQRDSAKSDQKPGTPTNASTLKSKDLK